MNYTQITSLLILDMLLLEHYPTDEVVNLDDNFYQNLHVFSPISAILCCAIRHILMFTLRQSVRISLRFALQLTESIGDIHFNVRESGSSSHHNITALDTSPARQVFTYMWEGQTQAPPTHSAIVILYIYIYIYRRLHT